MFCICSQAFAVPAKCLFQTDRHVSADGRLLVDDVVQGLACHAQDLRRTLDCQVQRLETFMLDDAAGWSGFFMGIVLFPFL